MASPWMVLHLIDQDHRSQAFLAVPERRILLGMSDRVTLCPSCKEQIEPGAARCVACEYALISPGGQRTVATRRDTYGEMPQSANLPGVGPGRECEGCDGSIIEARQDLKV
jgi:hypothetical protein